MCNKTVFEHSRFTNGMTNPNQTYSVNQQSRGTQNCDTSSNAGMAKWSAYMATGGTLSFSSENQLEPPYFPENTANRSETCQVHSCIGGTYNTTIPHKSIRPSGLCT